MPGCGPWSSKKSKATPQSGKPFAKDMKKNTKPYYCPKGTKPYSTHRFVEISRKKIGNGIYESKRKCKLCGKIDIATLDYMILSDLFSLKPRKGSLS
jgi:hypothetical protein